LDLILISNEECLAITLCRFDHPTFGTHQKNVGEGFMKEKLGVEKKEDVTLNTKF
jgi:hypothetical protein